MTVLGGHLYSTPAVAVRELVQNAHDSITRRRIAEPGFEGGDDEPLNFGVSVSETRAFAMKALERRMKVIGLVAAA